MGAAQEIRELVDPVRHPEASAYLAGLDAGLASFPGCKTRAVFLQDILTRYPTLFEDEGIHPTLRKIARGAPDAEAWTSTVEVVLALTLVRDRMHQSDEAFLEWNYQRQLGIYQRPLFRALMFLFSPTLLFMGAARRWKQFHTGGELQVSGDKRSAELALTYPPGLYSRVFRASLVASFRAALAASRAENQQVELLADEPGRARYRATWG